MLSRCHKTRVFQGAREYIYIYAQGLIYHFTTRTTSKLHQCGLLVGNIFSLPQKLSITHKTVSLPFSHSFTSGQDIVCSPFTQWNSPCNIVVPLFKKKPYDKLQCGDFY